MGEQLEVANKKLEIARGVIVALKADVASAQSEIGSLKSELETANNQAGDAAESAKTQIASLNDALTKLEAERDAGKADNLDLQGHFKTRRWPPWPQRLQATPRLPRSPTKPRAGCQEPRPGRGSQGAQSRAKPRKA